MTENIFRRESLDHVSSPEQLYDYIRVSNPGMWVVLAAILLLVIAGFFWAATAAIPTNLPVTALAISGDRYVCYLPPELGAGVKSGMGVQVGNRKGRVLEVGETPESFREVSRTLPSDYAAYALGLKDWNLKLVLEFDSPGVSTALPEPAAKPAAALSAAPAKPAAARPGADNGTFLQARITTARTRPLDFIFNPGH